MTDASIVITCYNHARYLADAIRSAIGQSAPNVEVIVVDDGSTDETSSVASGFPVRYIHQTNQGLSAARNTGLLASAGRFVCFLDADDTLLPQAIAFGLEAFAENPQAAFVYGDFCDVDAKGIPISAPLGPRVASHHYRALLESNFIGMHATALYRRTALQFAGGFDVRLRRCEDYEMYLRLARTFPLQEHTGVVAHYRRHDSNMSRDRGAMLKSVLGVLRMQKPHLRRDPELRRAARNGVAVWRRYYGELLYQDFLASRQSRFLLQLLRLSPRVSLSAFLPATKRRLKRAVLNFSGAGPLTRGGRPRPPFREGPNSPPFAQKAGQGTGCRRGRPPHVLSGWEN